MAHDYLDNMILRIYHYVLHFPKWNIKDLVISKRIDVIYNKNTAVHDLNFLNCVSVEEYLIPDLENRND